MFAFDRKGRMDYDLFPSEKPSQPATVVTTVYVQKDRSVTKTAIYKLFFLSEKVGRELRVEGR